MPPFSDLDKKTVIKAQHARNNPGSTSSRIDAKAIRRQPAAAHPPPPPLPPNIHYTLLIRLPFARGDFEDLPQVEWDATKDRKLWKIISKNPKSGDINWTQRAEEFGVTQPFLLQQAAWLYERHLHHVQTQMSKLRSSNVPTPTPGASAPQPQAGVLPTGRLGSAGGGASRAPSALSVRSRDSPVPRVDASIVGTLRANAPPLSRSPSTNTVTQSRHFLPPSPRQPLQRAFRISNPPASRKLEAAPLPATTEAKSSPSSLASSSTTSSSSDSDDPMIKRSQLFRRPPPFQQHKKSRLRHVGEDSSDEDSPMFLPFAKSILAGTVGQRSEDPSATLRDTDTDQHPRPSATSIPQAKSQPTDTTTESEAGESDPTSPIYKGKGKAPAPNRMESSASSASSAAPTAGNAHDSEAKLHGHGQQKKRLDALSPRHRAELARLSPRGQGGTQRDGSDGTPSMGSSFSDLDDTSITQSALEEALASNLRHGGASRLSSISHAFRSRYL